MSEDVVSSTDVAKKTPKSFRDLNKDELKAAALYFGTEDEGTKDALVADLAENGVTWEQYVDAFLAEKPEPSVPETVEEFDEAFEAASPVKVEAARPTALTPQSSYLIKMDRKNPYFEFGTYKFTQDNPYVIMPADAAQAILTQEQGFRQATPAELQEFYG